MPLLIACNPSKRRMLLSFNFTFLELNSLHPVTKLNLGNVTSSPLRIFVTSFCNYSKSVHSKHSKSYSPLASFGLSTLSL